jgi:peptide/nickel transport system substrate-binding protein
VAAIALVFIAAGSLGYVFTRHFGIVGGPDFREGLVPAERPLSLNPLIGSIDPAVRDVGHLLYRGLLKLDQTAYPRPDLASSYTVSTDGLTLRTVLATGTHWSDGRAITPADVVATVDFVQSSRAANHSLTALFQGIKVTVSGTAVSFTLPEPRASFASTLTQLPILPLGGLTPARVSAIAAEPQTPLATSGAYLVQFADINSVLLAPNPYAAVKPTLPSYQFRLFSSFSDAAAAFASAQVDGVLALTPAQRAQLTAVKGATAHDIATFRFVDLLMNERAPGLDNTVVRHALSTAVSRAMIVRGALHRTGGVVQVSAITEGLPWAAAAGGTEAASSEVAAAALETAGWVIGPSGVREKKGVVLAFTLTVPDVEPLPTVAREVASQMTPLGVNLYVDVVPALSFVNTTVVPHAFQLALADWDGGPDPDVSSFWRSNAVPPQGFNVSGGPIDPFLDQALDSLATLADPPARVAAAQSVNRYLADDAPAIFLYTPEVSYVVRLPMKSATVPSIGGSAARFDAVATWRRA